MEYLAQVHERQWHYLHPSLVPVPVSRLKICFSFESLHNFCWSVCLWDLRLDFIVTWYPFRKIVSNSKISIASWGVLTVFRSLSIRKCRWTVLLRIWWLHFLLFRWLHYLLPRGAKTGLQKLASFSPQKHFVYSRKLHICQMNLFARWIVGIGCRGLEQQFEEKNCFYVGLVKLIAVLGYEKWFQSDSLSGLI